MKMMCEKCKSPIGISSSYYPIMITTKPKGAHRRYKKSGKYLCCDCGEDVKTVFDTYYGEVNPYE